jgi:hypothetical protein
VFYDAVDRMGFGIEQASGPPLLGALSDPARQWTKVLVAWANGPAVRRIVRLS